MLNNTQYNKIKILHLLSKTSWFIQECAKKDAKTAGHDLCLKEYEDLQKILNNQIDILHRSLCNSCPK